MVDPYTETNAENATRNKRDPLRINSLENGILLCLCHHKAYDTFRFSIHPMILLPSFLFIFYLDKCYSFTRPTKSLRFTLPLLTSMV